MQAVLPYFPCPSFKYFLSIPPSMFTTIRFTIDAGVFGIEGSHPVFEEPMLRVGMVGQTGIATGTPAEVNVSKGIACTYHGQPVTFEPRPIYFGHKVILPPNRLWELGQGTLDFLLEKEDIQHLSVRYMHASGVMHLYDPHSGGLTTVACAGQQLDLGFPSGNAERYLLLGGHDDEGKASRRFWHLEVNAPVGSTYIRVSKVGWRGRKT